MQITDIKSVSKTKFKVYLDGQFAFTLYKGELFRYRIQEDGELSEEVYQEIREKVVLKRAKLRAMHLLNDMDRTESQLRTKLLNGDYPADIVDEAIAYVKSFGYINDESYIRRFIESKRNSKSKKEIYALLMKKGVDMEQMQEILSEYYSAEDSLNAIRDLLRKKRYDPKSATDQEMRKIYGYLARKGFGYEDIRQVIQINEWNA
mgnify:FL=1